MSHCISIRHCEIAHAFFSPVSVTYHFKEMLFAFVRNLVNRYQICECKMNFFVLKEVKSLILMVIWLKNGFLNVKFQASADILIVGEITIFHNLVYFFSNDYSFYKANGPANWVKNKDMFSIHFEKSIKKRSFYTLFYGDV